VSPKARQSQIVLNDESIARAMDEERKMIWQSRSQPGEIIFVWCKAKKGRKNDKPDFVASHHSSNAASLDLFRRF